MTTNERTKTMTEDQLLGLSLLMTVGIMATGVGMILVYEIVAYIINKIRK